MGEVCTDDQMEYVLKEYTGDTVRRFKEKGEHVFEKHLVFCGKTVTAGKGRVIVMEKKLKPIM